MVAKVAKPDVSLKTVAPLKLTMPKLGQSTTPPLAAAAPGAEALLASALAMPQLAGHDENGSSGDEDDGTEAVLMQAITSFFSKREEETKSKRASLMKETLEKIQGLAESVQASVAKDGKDGVAEARASVVQLERSMNATTEEIKALSEKYSKELQVLYHKYSAQYEQLAGLKQEATAKMQQRKAGAKRKLASLKSQSDKMLSELDERLAKLKPKKSPMDLYKAIESFNAVS